MLGNSRFIIITSIQTMKFLDEAKIYLKSGDGGAGCTSFHREKFVEFGGPDGGNGGKGGDVIFRATSNNNTLIDFRYQQHFKAQQGTHGMGRNRTGANGEHCIINVPVGTQVLDEFKEEILIDFTEDGQEYVFLRGGDGGFGNAHYKTATNQAPRKHTPGWPGQEAAIWLRLKLIADIGLLGLPNAGKSTFLSCVSNARPKVADYPFTTLHPNLGVVHNFDKEFVIADIPGIIEGAHEGTGLGTRFLGHVERSAALLHLVDCTQDSPAEAYNTIRNELEEYGAGLAQKEEIIALTKADALGQELAAEQLKDFEKATGKKAHIISSLSKDGLQELLKELYNCVYPQVKEW
jgi:GTP-binding protein